MCVCVCVRLRIYVDRTALIQNIMYNTFPKEIKQYIDSCWNDLYPAKCLARQRKRQANVRVCVCVFVCVCMCVRACLYIGILTEAPPP